MRAMLMALLLLGGCTTTRVDGNRLTGVQFTAVDINGAPVPAGPPITLTLGSDGRATGNAGCNGFFANYRLLSSKRIAFDGVGSTKRACEPERMEAERNFLTIVEAARGYNFYRDGGLSLISPDGRAIRFRL